MRQKGTPKAIGRWLHRLPSDAASRGDGFLLRLSVLTMTERLTLATWKMEVASQPEAWGAEALQAGQDDADQRGTVTEYSLQFVQVETADAAEQVLATYTMRLSVDDDTRLEEASLPGVIQQLMRHLEAGAKINAQMLTTSNAQMVTLCQMLFERVGSLESTHRAALEALRDGMELQLTAVGNSERDERRGRIEEKLVELLEPIAKGVAVKAATWMNTPPANGNAPKKLPAPKDKPS